MKTMTPQPTPQAIKEASENYAKEQWKEFPHNIGYCRKDFEAGATHPETEKAHINLFLEVLEWADNEYSPVVEIDETRDGLTNFNKWYKISEAYEAGEAMNNDKYYTFSDLLQLYREQTNKNNEG